MLADKPVAYYRLDDASGTGLCDASPSKNDGKYDTHGITYGQPGSLQAGPDAAITADGTANPATSKGSSTIVGSTDFTLEGWFKTTTKADQIVVDIGQPGAGKMAGIGPSSTTAGDTLCGGLDNAIGFDTYDGYITADAGAIGVHVFDGKWHYVVGSYTAAGGGKATIYLDGKLLKSGTVDARPAASVIRVGYWVDAVCNSPFSGSVDEVAVYHSALSATSRWTQGGRGTLRKQ